MKKITLLIVLISATVSSAFAHTVTENVALNFTVKIKDATTFLVQQQTVTGVVTDQNGETLPGVNVLIKGTNKGTVTDFNGNYQIEVNNQDIMVFSYVGFVSQEIIYNGQTSVNVTLVEDATQLKEVVIIGYGSTTRKEITSAVTVVREEDFNKGTVNSPVNLLQGKVAGLSIYNKGGNPNSSPVIRLRGISTVGANASPLIVIDGIVGASLENIDPSDIESINVLKDGSAAAIYGTRGSSGVILVTTKKGRVGSAVNVNYNSSIAASSVLNSIDIMTADEFIAAGLANLGSKTDWVGEVTETGISKIHNISIAGGRDNTTYRLSANFRDVGGIVKNTGFEQFNTRANISTRLLNDKLKVNFSTSYTKRDSDRGSGEVMKYATLYNPTAPIYAEDSPFEFNGAQYGGYFETLGLFDSYNPVSIQNQLQNTGSRKRFNYNLTLNYDLTDKISAKIIYGSRESKYLGKRYSPTTLLRGGNASSPTRKGDVSLSSNESGSELFEVFGTYKNSWGNLDLTFTGGYSFQESDYYEYSLGLGDFPDTTIDYINAIELSFDLREKGYISASSDATEDDRLIAFFGRANMTWDDAIFFSASLRREGSSRFGEGEKWGLFPSVGLGVDVNRYLSLDNVDLLKIRLGYGVTGAIPGQIGLSQDVRPLGYDPDTGAANTGTPSRDPNPDLRWEEKAEINLGIEFNMGRLSTTVDIYSRDVTDFILNRTIEASSSLTGATARFDNAGDLKTTGFELALNYDIISKENLTYNSGIILSSYKSKLEKYVLEDGETRGNLGSPGQNSTNMILVKPGEDIGQIWGPVFSGEIINGVPQFKDLNSDGEVITGQDQALNPDADFTKLGNGIPDFELGWTNQLSFGRWQVNAFFRGAFGHSLVNTFRAFYEPRISSQSSYNLTNTKFADDEITSAIFSSLYVEKADFFKLDNLSISYGFDLGDNKYISGLRLTGSGQNLFVITNYTGSDPEPSLGGDILAPGIDRRENYFSSRTFTLGLNINF